MSGVAKQNNIREVLQDIAETNNAADEIPPDVAIAKDSG